MEKELALYLAEQHGQQESLPLDLSSFYRKLRRCSDRDKFRNLNTLASADDLAPAVLKFREHKLIDTDILHFGSKSLLMLTRTNVIALQRFIAQVSWDPNKDVREQTCEHPRRAVTKSDDAEMQKLASASEGKSPEPRYTQQQDIAALLGKPTALEASAVAYFTKDAHSIREFCPHGTRMECDRRARMMSEPSSIGLATPLPSRTATNQRCMKLHFKPVIESHTDVSLGDCAYLSTCRRTRTCKYIHYEIEETTSDKDNHVHRESESARRGVTPTPALTRTPRAPAQWVNVDVRNFDLSVLGQFSVIMADPPWEIHMDLPYGTMSDDEMCKLDFPKVQEEEGGLLFLWVTGRAMERAREIFQYWGYKQLEEIIWIKTNQLQKVIRTGRTGHWLNHSKEHCLVGVKGDFVTAGLEGGGGRTRVNHYVDCDVIVAEARETSRKPDEIYDIIERLCPDGRKIEVFGRKHNIREGWITVGNQLPPTHLVGDTLVRYREWEATER